MLYSFDFAAQVTRICMDEIRRRVFREQRCTPDDVTHVSIHSVATLMQDTLWCCQERIVPKTVWRVINYETCTLSSLSRYLTSKGEQLLIEILDFLVELMQHKGKNLMDAYHLGEAMGKVTLGPADCDPIIAEKASHFLTRMIIEHSKRIHMHKQVQQQKRVDSGVSLMYDEIQPMSKIEAARAKAKSYDRLIRRIRYSSHDWAANIVGIRAMLDDDYEPEPITPEEPWISVFCTELSDYDPEASPLLFRIVSEASKPVVPIPADPFVYLSNEDPAMHVQGAFSEFAPLCARNNNHQQDALYPSHHHDHRMAAHLKKINHSFSNMKLNLRKPRSHDSAFSSEETVRGDDDARTQTTSHTATATSNEDGKYHHHQPPQQQKHVRSMVRKVIKMSSRKHLQQQSPASLHA
ncbi:hypothetical protein K492DRAFT_168241 [Lichtheimia hyalospora FSU 10163]|nr:hypothetical protein K492DRAFT_168241 [Lichtheimia hyalospora FSU 10163]